MCLTVGSPARLGITKTRELCPAARRAAALRPEFPARAMALVCGHFVWADSAPVHSAADAQMDQE